MYEITNKIRKIQILSLVVFSTFLLQENFFFFLIVQVCMCTLWNSHPDDVNIEIDNDVRGVIGDFKTISDIRITKAEHLVFQNKAKNIPRQDFMVMNIT